MNNFRLQIPTDIRFGRDRLTELPGVLEPTEKMFFWFMAEGQLNVQDCITVY